MVDLSRLMGRLRRPSRGGDGHAAEDEGKSAVYPPCALLEQQIRMLSLDDGEAPSQAVQAFSSLRSCVAHGSALLLPESPRRVRFVHVSDTHMRHTDVHIPEGNVLLHTGDLLANYSVTAPPEELLGQLSDVLAWVQRMARRFELVVLIAGNHDTLLDGRCSVSRRHPELHAAALAQLGRLPRNVVYCNGEPAAAAAAAAEAGARRRPRGAGGSGSDSGSESEVSADELDEASLEHARRAGGVRFRGLRLWGCPVGVSRLETMGCRYLSDGFERRAAARLRAWRAIPEGLDVLLTHAPPAGSELVGPSVGDAELQRAIAALARPPAVHCFGHDHHHFGLALLAERRAAGGGDEADAVRPGMRAQLNASQERVLRAERKAAMAAQRADTVGGAASRGGCALVFDLLARGAEARDGGEAARLPRQTWMSERLVDE